MNLLLLHGALASKHQFDPILPLLPSDWNVHTMNFSGHGGRMIPLGGLNFERFTKDILEYLEENKLERINLFGYSMGGYAALLFAMEYPSKVEKIFTLNVKFKWDAESTMKETRFMDPEKMMEKVPFFAQNLMLQHGMNLWKDLLSNTSEMMNNLTHNRLLKKEDFEQIKAPCLLAVGENDQTSSIAETIEARQFLPEAQLLVIPGAPHPFEKIDPKRIQFEMIHYFGS